MSPWSIRESTVNEALGISAQCFLTAFKASLFGTGGRDARRSGLARNRCIARCRDFRRQSAHRALGCATTAYLAALTTVQSLNSAIRAQRRRAAASSGKPANLALAIAP